MRGGVKIKVLPINTILEQYVPKNQHIDFISLDVEGYEWKILQSFNFEKYSPDFFLVEELDFTNKDFMEYYTYPIYSLLKEKGYIVVAKTKRTVVFKKQIVEIK
jgi:hypothetical protein